jgi:hypothetical protein
MWARFGLSERRITIGRAQSGLLAIARHLATKRSTMEADPMLFRQHERWVEELSAQLQLEKPITGSGSILTLPVATLDLQDWTGDQREFLPVRYDDWQQVIGDYRESVANSGPKILAAAAPHTAAIDALLPNLTSSSVAADGSRTDTMDVAVRGDILVHLQQLDTVLSSDPAIIAAWRDLVSSCQKLHRAVDEVSFRRDTPIGHSRAPRPEYR